MPFIEEMGRWYIATKLKGVCSDVGATAKAEDYFETMTLTKEKVSTESRQAVIKRMLVTQPDYFENMFIDIHSLGNQAEIPVHVKTKDDEVFVIGYIENKLTLPEPGKIIPTELQFKRYSEVLREYPFTVFKWQVTQKKGTPNVGINITIRIYGTDNR